MKEKRTLILNLYSIAFEPIFDCLRTSIRLPSNKYSIAFEQVFESLRTYVR